MKSLTVVRGFGHLIIKSLEGKFLTIVWGKKFSIFMQRKIKPNPQELDYVETKRLLLSVPDVQDRAMFCLAYCAGLRVSELNRIRKKDILFEKINDKNILVILSPTEKNKVQVIRNIPIPYDREKELCDTFFYLPRNPEYPMFQFSRVCIFLKAKKYFGFHPHWFRHLRATHLIQVFNFNDNKLIQFFGWSDARPAKVYAHLNYKDLVTNF